MKQWTRRHKLYIINLYGKGGMNPEDGTQNHKLQTEAQQELQGLGRVPWIIGGDWNQEATQVELTWEIGGEIARTGSATQEHGRELDWFMVSRAMQEIGGYGRKLNNRSKDTRRSG